VELRPIRKMRVRLWYVAVAVLVVIAAFVLWNFQAVRTPIRWFAWSHYYKTQVLAQPPSSTAELKHIEWDGWGWAGQDTTVYLVFDPTDSLSAAAKRNQPGKFNGLPCEVVLVRRLENNWYIVQFYTNEAWGQRNALECCCGSGQ